jgi:peptidylprolyl isomerase domain and WD repeat-containing protein 1
VKQYDESLAVYEQASRDGTLGIETLDFGRRTAVERELEESEALNTFNAVFDESDNFLIFATMIGIKIVSLSSSRVVRVLGRVESGQRFVSVSLYQGIPRVDTQYMLAKHAGAAKYARCLTFCQIVCRRVTLFASYFRRTSEELLKGPVADPTIYATAFKARRFYTFSQREPKEATEVTICWNVQMFALFGCSLRPICAEHRRERREMCSTRCQPRRSVM